MIQSNKDILLEIMKYCGENNIPFIFTQDDTNGNEIEVSTIDGERVVEIQIGEPKKEDLNEILSDFLRKLKE